MPHLSRLSRFVEMFDKKYCEATVTPISVLGAAANYNARLGGSVAKQFTPTHALITCLTAAAALNGDCQIQLGTTNGGAELMAAFPLVGLTGVGTKHLAVFAGAVPAMLANALVYVRMTLADSSGNAGTFKVDIIGRQS